MSKKTKIIAGLGAAVVVVGALTAFIRGKDKDLPRVTTAKVDKMDLVAKVTANGKIQAKNKVDMSALVMGQIVNLAVKEGDHVKKGQVVAELQSVQADADVVAQKAAIATSLADSAAAEANIVAMEDGVRTNQATLEKQKTELQRTKLNLDRATELYNAKLMAKQDFDQKKAEYDTAVAAIGEAEARLEQAKAQVSQARQQTASAQKRIAQTQAQLDRFNDVLAKYYVRAPLDGIVTDLPVRVGETVVPGVQNSAASTIMTVDDMSLMTAEIKVDETDIVNVKVDQPADVTIDAMPNQTFKGRVVEIGNTAILRSTGLAASTSTTANQEAKDFKVVIAIDNPPDDIRPGLSCTGKIVTATKLHALTIPIQALTVRQRGDLEQQDKNKGVEAASKIDPAAEKAKKEELQGVFVIRNGRAQFVQVATGITGTTDIEVMNGLNDGDRIVTGPYKVIRTLRNDVKIKVDNKLPVVGAGS
jgi:HlyD family secretion protein